MGNKTVHLPSRNPRMIVNCEHLSFSNADSTQKTLTLKFINTSITQVIYYDSVEDLMYDCNYIYDTMRGDEGYELQDLIRMFTNNRGF